MKPITPEEVRAIQCDILQDVADFCEKSKLTYFLAYGTLIGAIRHNGFIPWDDDIDIAMPRPDYDKFIRLYNNKESNYRVIDISINNSYTIPFAKVYHERTWLNEFKYKRENFGVYIDIVPIDGVVGKWQLHKAQKLDKLIHVKKANFKNRSLIKNLFNYFVKILLSPFTIERLLKCSDSNARKYAFGTTPKAANMLETYGVCEAVDTSVFEDTIFHEFEDRNFRIPIGYDQWLRSIYGDYMKLPPKDQQVAHHSFNAYWKD